MKMRNTLILLIILVALGTYVYFVEIKHHEKVEQAKQESKQLFNLEKDSVETLILENSKGTFTVKKIQNEWRITEPVYTEADEATINSMLTSLLDAQKETEFSLDDSDPSNYGLSNRAMYVHLNTFSGEQDSIWIGEKTPVGSFVFSFKNDSMVYTINQSVKTNFDKSLFDIRDKNLLHFNRDEVRKIVLTRPGQKIEFEKSGPSDWQILNINRPADNGKISGILSKLNSSKAKAFVDEEGDNLSEFGLQNPRYQVQLILGQEQGQKEFKVSRKINGKYYARDVSRRPVFEIDSALVKDLKQSLSDFRNKDLASFNRSDITQISIQYADTAFTCIKDSLSSWFLKDSVSTRLKSQSINSFFSNLDFITISEFVRDGSYNPSRYGLDDPSLKIDLYEGEEHVLEVKLGNVSGDNVYAMTDKYESVYLIPKNKLTQLKLKLDEIIEAPVVSSEEITGAKQ